MNKKNNRIIFFDIDYTLFDTLSFKESNFALFQLYPGVKSTIELLSKNSTLGILSTGEDKSLEFENLSKKFTDKEIWFVEDKINMLELAKKYNKNLRTIWFKNGPFVDLVKSNFTPDKVIYSFTDLSSLQL
jgi:hypothetical protein